MDSLHKEFDVFERGWSRHTCKEMLLSFCTGELKALSLILVIHFSRDQSSTSEGRKGCGLSCAFERWNKILRYPLGAESMGSLKTKEMSAAFAVPTLWMSKTKERQAGPVSPVSFPKEDKDKHIPMGSATEKKPGWRNTFVHLSPHPPGSKVPSQGGSWCQTLPVSEHLPGSL